MACAGLAVGLSVLLLGGYGHVENQQASSAQSGAKAASGGAAASGGSGDTGGVTLGGSTDAVGGSATPLGGTGSLGGNASGAGGTPAQCGVGGRGNGSLSPPRSISTAAVEPQICSHPGQASEPMDQCACEGLVCADGESCRSVTQPPRSGAGGADVTFNGCFPLCQGDGDCEAPKVCVRNLYGLDVCALVDCRSNADCTADSCGSCEQGYFYAHLGIVYEDPSLAHCVYAGLCGVSSCAGCANNGEAWHDCE